MSLTRLLTSPWRGVNRLRRALYRAGILRAARLPRPVISIGALAAGGSGKTPTVIAVCRALSAAGLRPVVLTRGYGRAGGATGLVSSADARRFGDEPVLIRNATDAAVLVGENRHENATAYLRDHDCDVFVLDDGFQHLQLHRDLDVVIDAPGVLAREGRSALRDAGIVLERRLETRIPDALRGQRVFAFAGLADNDQFFDALRRAGVELAGTRGFADHHRYSPNEVTALLEAADGLPLVTTEKDAVKLDHPAIVAVPAAMQIDEETLGRIVDAARPEAPRRRRKRRKGALLQRVEYAAFRGVVRFVSTLSEAAVARWGARLGSFMGRLLRSRDRLAMRNLRRVFPDRAEPDRRRILDECWRHFGREGLQFLRMQDLSLEQVASRCSFDGIHLLEESMARGRGTLLMSAHWGGWEIGGLAIMSVVRDIRTVARPLDNELIERDLQRFREATGAEVVDRRGAARSLLRGLLQNGVVVLLPDQAVQPQEGILVPFLGHLAWTTPAPARLALRTGATIVISFCIPDGLRHRIEFVESIRPDLLSPEERTPEALMRRINEALSRRIEQQPELWLWMHDRWKGTTGNETLDAV